MIKSGTNFNPDETEGEKKAVLERARKDVKFCAETFFPHYCSSESGDFQISWAKRVGKKKTFKGFSEWPRGHAKSVWNTIFIPFWLWLRGEPVYLVVIGDSYNKAKTLLSDIHGELEVNPQILHYLGEQKKIGSWEDGFFQTTGGFVGAALGLGQNVRGLRKGTLRPTICVVDDIETKDLNKNPKRQDAEAQWVERDLIPTMDGPHRRYIHSNNKYANRMVQTVLQERHPGWYVHHIKAYDPITYEPTWASKYTAQYWRDMEDPDEGIGVIACRAEFLQIPHKEGKIWKDEDFQWAKLPRLDHFDLIVGHWDVAYAGTSTSDYNAVRLWGLKGRNFYMIDCFVRQSKMDKAIDWMCRKEKEIKESYKTDIHIQWQFEAQFWNDAVEQTIQEVSDEHKLQLNLIKVDTPKSKKYDRILSTQVYYQGRRVYINQELKSHNDTLQGIEQIKGIEPGYTSKDDAPDADEGAFSRLQREIYIGTPSPPQYGDTYTNKLV
jgi:phage terminase large subunit-like protein